MNPEAGSQPATQLTEPGAVQTGQQINAGVFSNPMFLFGIWTEA